ncbi:MAG: hypothetical protein NUW37_03460 [Planctomycetes bacterium]|nr:hypothetical protein [Planctomycetota bacterium]
MNLRYEIGQTTNLLDNTGNGATIAQIENGALLYYNLMGQFDNLLNPTTRDPNKDIQTSCFEQSATFELLSKIVGLETHSVYVDPLVAKNRIYPISVFGDRPVNGLRPTYWNDEPVRSRAYSTHAYNVTGSLQLVSLGGDVLSDDDGSTGAKSVYAGGFVYDALFAYGGFPVNPTFRNPGPSALSNEVYFWRWMIDSSTLAIDDLTTVNIDEQENDIQSVINPVGQRSEARNTGHKVLSLRIH